MESQVLNDLLVDQVPLEVMLSEDLVDGLLEPATRPRQSRALHLMTIATCLPSAPETGLYVDILGV